jgi:hypothetical protein
MWHAIKRYIRNILKAIKRITENNFDDQNVVHTDVEVGLGLIAVGTSLRADGETVQ